MLAFELTKNFYFGLFDQLKSALRDASALHALTTTKVSMARDFNGPELDEVSSSLQQHSECRIDKQPEISKK